MDSFTVLAKIRFRRVDEGGLKASFRPYDYFTGEQYQLGYMMEVDGKYFDFRIYQPPLFIKLGQSYDMVLKFLFPDLVSRRLFVGKKFTVWSSRTIAEGIVVKESSSEFEIPCERRFGTPDFYLVVMCNGSLEVKPCFLNYSTCVKGMGSVCGMYVQNTTPMGTVTRLKCNTQKMVLYCPVDVLNDDVAWCCRVVILRIMADAHHYDVQMQSEGMLFKDLDSAMTFQKVNMVLNDDIDFASALSNTKKIMSESNLFDIAVAESKTCQMSRFMIG